MASFYNPYSKNIQWAQGFADIANQLIMMKMMQKMYGGGQPGQQQPGPNPQAVAAGGPMRTTPYQHSGIPNQGPIGMPGEGFGNPAGMGSPGGGMGYGPETSPTPSLFGGVPSNQNTLYLFLQKHPELAELFAAISGGGF